MKYGILLFFALFVTSCFHNELENTVSIRVTNIELIDVGQVHYEPHFSAFSTSEGSNVYKCRIRTVGIKKNDSIESLKAFVKGNELKIDITSSPFDFDCYEDSCFTVHDLNFNLIGLKPRKYKMIIEINNGIGEIFTYEIQ